MPATRKRRYELFPRWMRSVLAQNWTGWSFHPQHWLFAFMLRILLHVCSASLQKTGEYPYVAWEKTCLITEPVKAQHSLQICSVIRVFSACRKLLLILGFPWGAGGGGGLGERWAGGERRGRWRREGGCDLIEFYRTDAQADLSLQCSKTLKPDFLGTRSNY